MKQSDAFNQVRLEKRQLFQSHWNQFLHSGFLKAALCLLTGAQLIFTLCAGFFAMELIDIIARLPESGPFWSYLLALLSQILVAVPGWVTVAALWNIRRHGLWQGETVPEPAGLIWLKRVNKSVCAVGWIGLFCYPAATIAAGEYLHPGAVDVIFWLFVALTAILVIRITLVRVVLREAGENISCCWGNTKLLLPLIVVVLLLAAAAIVYGDFAPLFCGSVSLLLLSYGLVLGLYYRCMSALDRQFTQIDVKVAAKCKDPYDDPYSRY